jgi:predicted transcriptional regulator
MEIRFTPELEAKLNRIAAENRRGPAEYVRELVEHYVDHDAWFRQEVKKGLDQLDHGESIPHDEVVARIERMFPS